MMKLKDSIYENHEKAEKMPFNRRMFNGELSKEEYLSNLVQQFEFFSAIENIGLPSPTLARAELIKEDIRELKIQGCISDTVLNSTKEYVSYISPITYEKCLPHVYLNYLALLYGGQMMKKKVPSSGFMFKFENKKEAMKSIRQIQKDEWAEEVNKGFDFIIAIFEELELYCMSMNKNN